MQIQVSALAVCMAIEILRSHVDLDERRFDLRGLAGNISSVVMRCLVACTLRLASGTCTGSGRLGIFSSRDIGEAHADFLRLEQHLRRPTSAYQ